MEHSNVLAKKLVLSMQLKVLKIKLLDGFAFLKMTIILLSRTLLPNVSISSVNTHILL